MSEKRKQQSFEYGAIILLASTLIVKAIGALFKVPLSNLIGDLGFGYFSSAYDLFLPIYALSMAGLPVAVARITAEQITKKNYKNVRQTLRVARRAFFIAGTVGFLAMLLLIYPFVKVTDPTGQTVYSLFAIAPSILFCCIMSTYRGYYEGLRNMYPTAVSDVIEALGKLILGYGFAYIVIKLNGNVAYAAAAAMLGITIGAMLGALYLRLRHTVKGDAITPSELALSGEPDRMRVITKSLIFIAIPVVLSSLATNISTLIDVSMVKWQLTHVMENNADTVRAMYESSIADYNITAKHALTNADLPTFLYGIRGKAYTMFNLLPTITSVLGVSALPVLTSSWISRNRREVKRNINSIIKMTALIAMPGGVGLFVLSNQIMELFYHSKASVEIGGPMLSVFGITAIFAGLSIPMTSMLQAIGKQKVPVKNIAVGAVLKIIVNFILVGIPSINIKGAPLGTFACYFYIFISNFWCLIKYTKIIPDMKKVFLKPLTAAVLCGLAAFGISFLGSSKSITILSIAAAGMVYLIALIVLNTFEESDILSLPKGDRLLKICQKYRIIR